MAESGGWPGADKARLGICQCRSFKFICFGLDTYRSLGGILLTWCFTPSQPLRLYQGQSWRENNNTTVTIYFIHPRLQEIKAVVRAYTFVQGRTELHIIISIIHSHETHTLTYTLLDMTLCLSQSTYTKAYAKQNLNLNHAHVSSSILSGFFHDQCADTVLDCNLRNPA